MQKLILKRRKLTWKKDDGRTEIDKVEHKQSSILGVCKEIVDLLYLAIVLFVIARYSKYWESTWCRHIDGNRQMDNNSNHHPDCINAYIWRLIPHGWYYSLEFRARVITRE